MINQTEQTEQTEQAAESNTEVLFSMNLGVTISKSNPISSNKIIVDAIGALPSDSVTDDGEKITFVVDASSFAHFSHMVYCYCPLDTKLNIEFDGIYPIIANDENSISRNFNAQLCTLSQVPV